MEIQIKTLVDIVGEYYGISQADILSDRRTKDFVRGRHVVAWLAATRTSKSLPAIGRCLGGRDHTSILHARNKIERLRQEDRRLARELAEIIELVEVVEASLKQLRIDVAPDIDPLDVARRVVARPGLAASITVNEIQALASYVAAFCSKTEDDPNDAITIDGLRYIAAWESLATPPPSIRRRWHVPPVLAEGPAATAVSLGDPPPGRSALDQRQQSENGS